MKTINLSSTSQIPIIGFGTYQLTENQCTTAVTKALEVGYRHIDTADRYSNHKCIAKSLASSSIPRNELFITTKVWWDDLKRDDIIAIARKSIIELKCEYIDLLLIHWPNPTINIYNSLEGLAKLKSDGLIREFGVSNFNIEQLEEALSFNNEIRMNQIEIHPSNYPAELINYCKTNNIAVTAYSPLAQGKDLNLPEIIELSKKYKKSTAQVILNWLISKNLIVIPKAQRPEYIKDNFEADNWALNNEDIKIIDSLNTNNKII